MNHFFTGSGDGILEYPVKPGVNLTNVSVQYVCGIYILCYMSVTKHLKKIFYVTKKPTYDHVR